MVALPPAAARGCAADAATRVRASPATFAFLFISLALSGTSTGPSAGPADLWKQKQREGYHIAGEKSRLRCGRNLLGCGLCTESVAGAEGMRVAFPCCGFVGFWPKLACDHYLQCELSVKPQRMFCHILHPVGSMIVRYEFFLNHFTHAEGRNRLIGRALRPSPKETSLAPHR